MKEVQVDHIAPIVDPETGFISWDDYIDKLFCTKDNLQVLCKSCHKAKSKLENEQRRKSCVTATDVKMETKPKRTKRKPTSSLS